MRVLARRIFISLILVVTLGQGSAISAEIFRIQLANGKMLFDENEVEYFHASSRMFTLKPACSKRLVSNWSAFIEDDERVKPEGEYFDAAESNSAFQAMLGDTELTKGTVASLAKLYGAHDLGVVLYGEMPLVTDERVRLGIGKMTGDLKHMVEQGPGSAFVPVLGKEVTEHFRRLGKLR